MIAAIFFAVSFLKDHVTPEWLRSIAQEAVVALEEVKLILSLLAKHQKVIFFGNRFLHISICSIKNTPLRVA